MNIENLKYPIGKFEIEHNTSYQINLENTQKIILFPDILSDCVKDMNDEQLDTPYRDGGWTVRQLVHHIADSHTNCYIRFKLALTEDSPIIRPYKQNAWAELPDYTEEIQTNILFIKILHKKWGALLSKISITDWNKTFIHPETHKVFTLDTTLALYVWHGNHHLAHIVGLKQRMGW
ncbi:MAG: putative metal-dependent hydrolase [Chitinophagaceae bacterium]|nr:putative metal-dependent hydrolase [Chitinophagaceae bacterium]